MANIIAGSTCEIKASANEAEPEEIYATLKTQTNHSEEEAFTNALPT